MEFDGVFTVKKSCTKESFLRALLVKLAQNEETPADVVNCKFGEVQEVVAEILYCSAHVEYDVSASIGYDRQEQYIEQERYYDNDLKQWRTKDVVKTRTVTDWRPYSSHGSGDSVATATNRQFDGKYSSFFAYGADRTIGSLNPADVTQKGEASVSSSALESAKRYCAIRTHDLLPGDRQKDERYSDNVTVQTVTCFKLPAYLVEFTYNGVKYYAAGMACGDYAIECEYPKNEQKVDLKAEGEKVAKPFKIGAIIGWVTYSVFFLLSAILCWFGVSWLWVFSLIGLVAAIVLTVKRDKTYNAKVQALGSGIAAAKRQEIDRALASAGYERLSAEESRHFDSRINTSELTKDARRGSSSKAPAIVCSILLVILIIASLVIGVTVGNMKKSEAIHTADQFTVTVTGKSQEYKSNVSPYINGCYYVYLDFKVSAKDLGAEWMKIETEVYKNGTKLGTITTNLEYMNLDANSTKTYKTSMQDNQPEINNNTFFIAMYNANYSELTFKTKIVSIRFSDGEYYNSK